MLQVPINVFLKSFPIVERGMWLCKKGKVLKNGQVSEISKTMGTQMPTIKERERDKIERKKIAHAL
jgi:hypothetical protein